jgi:cytochrome P450
MISFVLVIFVAVLLTNLLKNKFRVVKLAAKIPGHSGMPFIGILPEFFGADHEKIFQIMLKYTKWPRETRIAKLWLGPELLIVVNSPECIQTVFNSKSCIERPNFYDFIDLKKGLLFGTISTWKSHRKVLDQAFTVGKLRSFVPQFDEKLKTLVHNLEECSGDIDILAHISECFLETFLKTTMEYDADSHVTKELLEVHDR